MTLRSRPRWPTRYRWRCSWCSRASPRAASCPAAARCVRLRPRADRRDHRQEPGQRTSARDASPTPRRATTAALPSLSRAAAGVARRFFAAAQDGDLAGLEALLAHDVVLTGDGGGKVPALARSLHGRNRVARTLLDSDAARLRVAGTQMRPVEVNGSPGLLVLDGRERVVSVLVLEIGRDQIDGVAGSSTPTSWLTSDRRPPRRAAARERRVTSWRRRPRGARR